MPRLIQVGSLCIRKNTTESGGVKGLVEVTRGKFAPSCEASDAEATEQWFELRTASQTLALRSDSPHGVAKKTKKTLTWSVFLVLVTRGRIELPFQP